MKCGGGLGIVPKLLDMPWWVVLGSNQ